MPAKPGSFSDRPPTLPSTSRQEGFGSPPLYPPQKDVAPCLTRADRRGQKFWTEVTVLGEGPCKNSPMPAPSASATETALVAGGWGWGGGSSRPPISWTAMTGPDASISPRSSEGRGPVLPAAPPPTAAGWQSVLSIHPGQSCRCAPRSRVSSPRTCCCCGYCARVRSCPILARPSV